MKLKKSQLKVESGQACRRYHTLPYPQLLQAVRGVPDLQQKAGFTLLSRNSRKLHSRAAQPISDCSSPTNQKPHTLDSQLPQQWTLCSSQPLPNPPFFPYKNKPPSLILWICLWVYHSLHFPSCKVPHYSHKLTFASKITGYYIVKVDRINKKWYIHNGILFPS